MHFLGATFISWDKSTKPIPFIFNEFKFHDGLWTKIARSTTSRDSHFSGYFKLDGRFSIFMSINHLNRYVSKSFGLIIFWSFLAILGVQRGKYRYKDYKGVFSIFSHLTSSLFAIFCRFYHHAVYMFLGFHTSSYWYESASGGYGCAMIPVCYYYNIMTELTELSSIHMFD